MTSNRLARLLGAIVASAAGSWGVASCAPCPYTETVRSFDIEVDGTTACGLLRKFHNEPLYAMANACAAACGDPEVNDCSLDADYIYAYEDAGAKDGGGGAGGGSSDCPAEPTKVTLNCRVTERG